MFLSKSALCSAPIRVATSALCLSLLHAPAFAQQTRGGATATGARVMLRDPHHHSDPKYRSMAQKLRLEAGADVLPTEFLNSEEAEGDRDLLILRAMQRAEGGYDAVNIYDRGILSWGIMQWAAHENSLQDCLQFIKDRLVRRGQGRVWSSLFKSQGLDVQGATFHVGGPTSWKPVVGIENLRIVFRGTRTVGAFDGPTVTKWARVFARAGRNSQIQHCQNLWATRRLRGCLNQRVVDGMRVRDITRGDLFSDALYFTFWTNNPAAARRHLAQAVANARLVSGKNSPSQWPPTLFPYLWEQIGLTTTFGTWPARTRITARMIAVGRVGREGASVQLASRGWEIGAVRRGERATSAMLWTNEPPISKPRIAPRLTAERLSPVTAVSAANVSADMRMSLGDVVISTTPRSILRARVVTSAPKIRAENRSLPTPRPNHTIWATKPTVHAATNAAAAGKAQSRWFKPVVSRWFKATNPVEP